MATCENGHDLVAGQAFCPACGARVTGGPGAPPAAGGWPPAAGAGGWPDGPYPPGPPLAPPDPPTAPVWHQAPAWPGPPNPPVAEGRKGRRGRVLLVGGLAVAVLGAGGFLWLRADDGPDSRLVVVAEGGVGEGDLFLVPEGADPGEAEPFATNAYLIPVNPVDVGLAAATAEPASIAASPAGTVVAWMEDDETHVGVTSVGDPEIEELFSGTGYSSVYYDSERNMVLVASDDGSCHAGPPSGDLDRIVRADRCAFGPSGNVVAIDGEDDSEEGGELEVTIHDLEGDELATFTTWDEPMLSASGALVTAGDGEELRVLRTEDGEEVASISADEVVPLDWALEEDALLYVSGDGDERTLAIVGASGDQQDLLTGPSVTGSVAPDGDTVIGAVVDDGTTTLSRISAATGEATRLLEEDDVQFELLQGEDPRVLAWSGEGSNVWFGRAASGDLGEVGSIDDLAAVTSVAYDEASGRAYLSASVGDGDAELFEVDEEVTSVADDFTSISVGASIDDGILATGEDAGGDSVLFSVVGGEFEELDRDYIVSIDAVRDGRVTYSVTTDDDDEAEEEVRSAAIDGSGRAETLQQDASIVGVARSIRTPWQSYGDEGGFRTPIGGGTCDTGTDVTNDSASGDVSLSGSSNCISVPSGGAEVTISVDADVDTVLTVWDEYGDEAASNDDGEDDFDPYIETFLDEGVYELYLEPYEDEYGEYTISATVD